MRVNVISESAFTVQGHGVHTAFTETVDQLRAYTNCEVVANASGRADITHLHTVGPYSLMKLLLARGRVVISAHVTPASFVGSLVGAKYWLGLAATYLRWFYNRADAVLAVSQETVDEVKALGVKRPVYLVPNTVETKPFAATPDERAALRARFGWGKGDFVVLGSGQVQPRKRLDVFVDAARHVPEAKFVWAGGIPFKALGADAGAMDQLMQTQLPNLSFTGLLPREQVINYFRAADLFWLPSDQETFGIVVVEAAAAGLPVLLRDIEQYRQTFGTGYERGNDTTFAEQIRQFAQDRAYYERWQAVARGIAERYNAQAGATRLMEVYQEVLDQRN